MGHRAPALIATGTFIVAAACSSGSGSSPASAPTCVPGSGSCLIRAGQSGTVSLSDGPSVAIPAHALTSDTTITIQASTGQPPSGALSALYRFEPDGTMFANAMTVSFPVSSGTTAAIIVWAMPGSTTEYEALATTVTGSTASAQVDYFGLGFLSGCGTSGEPCCSESACGDGLVCLAGFCQACGASGESCCSGDACGDELVCAEGTCQACGGAGELCCEEGCNAGFSCIDATCQITVTCGAHGMACCTSPNACEAGFACANGICECGGFGLPCCAANACDSGLGCGQGTCQACGDSLQPCCNNSYCNPGHFCFGGGEICTP